jgi:hypothetical protein
MPCGERDSDERCGGRGERRGGRAVAGSSRARGYAARREERETRPSCGRSARAPAPVNKRCSLWLPTAQATSHSRAGSEISFIRTIDDVPSRRGARCRWLTDVIESPNRGVASVTNPHGHWYWLTVITPRSRLYETSGGLQTFPSNQFKDQIVTRAECTRGSRFSRTSGFPPARTQGSTVRPRR